MVLSWLACLQSPGSCLIVIGNLSVMAVPAHSPDALMMDYCVDDDDDVDADDCVGAKANLVISRCTFQPQNLLLSYF